MRRNSVLISSRGSPGGRGLRGGDPYPPRAPLSQPPARRQPVSRRARPCCVTQPQVPWFRVPPTWPAAQGSRDRPRVYRGFGLRGLRASRNSQSAPVSARAGPVTGRARARRVLPAPEIGPGLWPRAKPGPCTNTEQAASQVSKALGKRLSRAGSQKPGTAEKCRLCASPLPPSPRRRPGHEVLWDHPTALAGRARGVQGEPARFGLRGLRDGLRLRRGTVTAPRRGPGVRPPAVELPG